MNYMSNNQSKSMDILCVVGARPQFVKLASFIRECISHNKGNSLPRVIHTGQHYDVQMSSALFQQLQLPPPYLNLEVGSGSHAEMTAKMLVGIEKELTKQRPDWVIVFGDTNSTLAAALAASKLGVRLAHIEAGERSYNRTMPEEINRVVTDHLSDLLFVSSHNAVINLNKEGLEDKAIITGDIMVDTMVSWQYNLPSYILPKLKVKEGEYYLVTIHRPSNVDDSASLGSLYGELKDIKTPIVFPCHPRTQKRMEENGLWEEVNDSWIVTPPIPYLEFHALLQKSKGVITDSGGIQKEAYFYKVPCFTLRSETEWIETVDAGWNTVVRPGVDSLRAAIDTWIEPKFHKPLYGDGRAAAKMVKALWSFEVNKPFDRTQ